ASSANVEFWIAFASNDTSMLRSVASLDTSVLKCRLIDTEALGITTSGFSQGRWPPGNRFQLGSDDIQLGSYGNLGASSQWASPNTEAGLRPDAASFQARPSRTGLLSCVVP